MELPVGDLMTGKIRRGRTSRVASRVLYFARFGEEKVWRGARVRVASSKKKTVQNMYLFFAAARYFKEEYE